MKRKPTSVTATPLSTIGIVLIIVIGSLATSGVKNSWLRSVIMMAIALVLSWPLHKANEAREKQLLRKYRESQNHQPARQNELGAD